VAAGEARYNPISYHNGSIWPHDTSLIVAGLARYGFIEEAARVIDGLLAALGQYADHRLPELFAGYGRQEIPFVVEYPTSSRPQAWASGSIFLLIAVMLGVVPQVPAWPDRARPFLPTGVERLRVAGIASGGTRVAVEVGGSGRNVRTHVAHEPMQAGSGRCGGLELRHSS
jgi:glycogen debranching enzyme